MHDLKKHVGALLEKAAKVNGATEAMQFAQAAVNAANAMATLHQIGQLSSPRSFTVAELEDLLERARLSPSQSVALEPAR